MSRYSEFGDDDDSAPYILPGPPAPPYLPYPGGGGVTPLPPDQVIHSIHGDDDVPYILPGPPAPPYLPYPGGGGVTPLPPDQVIHSIHGEMDRGGDFGAIGSSFGKSKHRMRL